MFIRKYKNPDSAVVLLSGGFDSVLLLHTLRYIFNIKDIHALFFDYHQKSAIRERSCARYWAEVFGIPFTVMNIEIPWSTSSLFGNSSEPYVPMRNFIFLSYAVSLAEEKCIESVAYGVFKGNHFADNTAEFVKNFGRLSQRATGVRLIIPHAKLTKDQVFRYAFDEFGLHPYNPNIWSCDENLRERCGHCLHCLDSASAIARGVIPPAEFCLA